MPDLPVLGERPQPSSLIPLSVAALVVGLLAGGVYWVTHRPETPAPPQTVAAVALDAGAAGPAVEVATPVTPASPELEVLTARVDGPLESSVVHAAGREVGAPLSQVVTRLLVWWLRVPQDLVRGDTLAVVYEAREGQEPLVHGLRFTSRKLGKTLEAWRFQPAGAPFPRFFEPDGHELEQRLEGGPLDTYEQVTSLLRDGRGHKGVDFKTPVGTPVRATFDGVIRRRTWNFRGNGNSLEVEELGGQGRTAMFLHLSELPRTLRPGQLVKRGEVIARSGNSGRSFAPHLHYQLMRKDQPLDPFTSHRTLRVSLPESDRPAFEATSARLRGLLPPASPAEG